MAYTLVPNKKRAQRSALGELFHAYRYLHNLTMDQFARRLGINKSALLRLENGTFNDVYEWDSLTSKLLTVPSFFSFSLESDGQRSVIPETVAEANALEAAAE